MKKLIQDALKIATSHKQELSDFLRKEGVSLPSLPEDKPQSDPAAIPLGTKMTDDEVINTLTINFIAAADMCAASASQSLRTDVGLMFLKFQMDKLSLGYLARDLMQKRGWLKIPPFYYPPGAPSKIRAETEIISVKTLVLQVLNGSHHISKIIPAGYSVFTLGIIFLYSNKATQ
ncbi:DUF3231 family protein [Virgibacillus sp. 179-BFC.A HS]|uniref:DUF3231 family protein n=1 Tax=Tigheibacillus jepli TaxID=3035914 RepID=A0ABU5CL71_9BACI|nr:DUF3231 family protein [Virgibacillus sp. 179-BFC.A HS]MDY0407103.1 DUF3231 family protein [Virgibacillus sp. 179-BFC.A HS]